MQKDQTFYRNCSYDVVDGKLIPQKGQSAEALKKHLMDNPSLKNNQAIKEIQQEGN